MEREESIAQAIFSLANSEMEHAEFVIFGIPFDKGQTGKRGSRFAPGLIREASWELESYSIYFDTDLERAKVCDAGDIKGEDFEDVVKKVCEFFKNTRSKVAIAMGGEHTVSYACVKALLDNSIVAPENFCYVVFDADHDLRDSYEGSAFNHACTCRRIYELTKRIVQVGIRTGCREDREFVRKNNIKVFYAWNTSFEALAKELERFDKIYLSVDMDAFDPCFAPGVATPEPFGLNPEILLKLFERFAGKIIGMDVVEVVPSPDGITQILAAKIIMEFIASKMRATSARPSSSP